MSVATEPGEKTRRTAERPAITGPQTTKSTATRPATALPGFADVTDQMSRNVEAVMSALAVAAAAGETLRARALEFTEAQSEATASAHSRLLGAKSPTEFFQLQSGFAQAAGERYLAELNGWAQVLTTAARDCARPIEQRFADAGVVRK